MWQTEFLGQVEFDQLEELQQRYRSAVIANPDLKFLLLSEPSPTFTRGRSAKDSDLLWSASLQSKKSVDVRSVARGGQWTYHGPGQLVIYPIVSLASLGYAAREIRPFLEHLRNAISTALAQATSPTSVPWIAQEHPFGIYVKNAKLVSFGMNFQQGVSTHGVAIYIAPQAQFFEGIHPCGQAEGKVISLQELGYSVSWNELAPIVAAEIKKSFKSSENRLSSFEN